MNTQEGREGGNVRMRVWRWGGDAMTWLTTLAILAAGVQVVRAAPGYEKQPVLQASQLAPTELLQGPRFQVDEKVPTDGFLARFTIRSDVGTFEAHGREMLRIRVSELAALEQLDAVSKTETFAKALGTTAMRPVKAAQQLITKPVETAKGFSSGVERLFGRVKRGSERAWEAATDSSKSSDERAAEVARRVGGVSVDALGYEQERRQLAKAVNADPYTTNAVLAAKLDELAWAAFAGRVGMDVVFSVLVPGSMALSGTTFTTDLVWDTPTPELARLNEQKLRDMGLDDKVVRAMMNNPWYSLSVLTVFVNSLEQLQGVEGREDVAKFAASATSEDQARFITESLQLLAHYHKTITPVSSVAGSGPVVARDSKGAVVVPTPVDYVAWTQRVAEFARRSDLKTHQRGVWLTGELSPRARREFTAAGWTVHEGVRWSMRQAGTQ
jgi:hypothetical protein